MITRPASTWDDWPATVDALMRLEQYAKAYSWTNTVDFQKACGAIHSFIKDGNALVVSGYLVMIDEVTPWYSNDKILQEWLVLKLYQGGDINDVPAALLAEAKKRGCKSVVTADSSPISIVADAYERAGFVPLTRSFTKGL